MLPLLEKPFLRIQTHYFWEEIDKEKIEIKIPAALGMIRTHDLWVTLCCYTDFP